MTFYSIDSDLSISHRQPDTRKIVISCRHAKFQNRRMNGSGTHLWNVLTDNVDRN